MSADPEGAEWLSTLNDPDLARIGTAFLHDVAVYVDMPGTPPMPPGIDAVRGLVFYLRSIMSDVAFRAVTPCVGQRSTAVVSWEASGTHDGVLWKLRPTGRRLVLKGRAMFRIEGGLVRELWLDLDSDDLAAQLGMAPLLDRSSAQTEKKRDGHVR